VIAFNQFSAKRTKHINSTAIDIIF